MKSRYGLFGYAVLVLFLAVELRAHVLPKRIYANAGNRSEAKDNTSRSSAYARAYPMASAITDIILTPSSPSVAHLTAVGTEIATLTATHTGLGANPIIKFAIKNFDANADTFKVVGNQLKTHQVINYGLLGASTSVILLASYTPSGGGSRVFLEKSIEIRVDPPTLTSITLSGDKRVRDDAAVSTVIGRLSVSGAYLPADASGITYAITGGNTANYFHIRGSRLEVVNTLPPASNTAAHNLQIKAHYLGIESAAVQMTINVVLAADVTGLTLSQVTEKAYFEGTSLSLLDDKRGRIGLLTATPPKSIQGQAPIRLYYAVSGSPNVFQLRNLNELHVVGRLEAGGAYPLTITSFYYIAGASPQPKKETSVTLRVSVFQADTRPAPVAPMLAELTMGVSGSAPNYTILVGKSGRLASFNATTTDGNILNYSIEKQEKNASAVDLFAINPSTGVLSLTKRLTEKEKAIYVLTLRAAYTDLFQIMRPISSLVRFEVVSSPTSKGLTLTDIQDSVVFEAPNLRILNTKSAGQIATLQSTPPSGVSMLNYSVSGSAVFALKNDHELHINTPLNTGNTYALTLRASYENALGARIQEAVVLSVAVMDDSKVVLPAGLTLTGVKAHVAPTGRSTYEVLQGKQGALGRLSARFGGVEELTYSITNQSDAKFFEIGVNDTLQVPLSRSIQANKTYTVSIKAAYTDRYQVVRAHHATLTFTSVSAALPSNLTLSQSEKGVYVLGGILKILDNKSIGKLGTITAQAPNNETLIYTATGAKTFEIKNGNELHVVSPLTAGQSYSLTLSASYQGAADAKITTSLTFDVEVVSDASIARPSNLQFLRPQDSLIPLSATAYHILVGKRGQLGRLAARFEGAEALTYTIETQSDDAKTPHLDLFVVDDKNNLSLKAGDAILPTSLRRIYVVTLKAAYTDLYGVARAATTTLTFTVVVNITGLSLSGDRRVEHLALGRAPIGRLSAQGLPMGAMPTFALVGKTTMDTFQILPNSNELRVGSRPPDYRMHHTHQVKVRADYHGFIYDSTFVIEVKPSFAFLDPGPLIFERAFPDEVPFRNGIYGLYPGKSAYLGNLNAEAPEPPPNNKRGEPAILTYTLIEQKTSDHQTKSFDELELFTNVFEVIGNELHLTGNDIGTKDTKYRLKLRVSYTDLYHETHHRDTILHWTVLEKPQRPINFELAPEEGIAQDSRQSYGIPGGKSGPLALLGATVPTGETLQYRIRSQTGNGEPVAIFEVTASGQLRVKAGSQIEEGIVYEMRVALFYQSTHNQLGLVLTSAISLVSLRLTGLSPAKTTKPTHLAFTAGANIEKEGNIYSVAQNRNGRLGHLSANAPDGKTLVYELKSQTKGTDQVSLFKIAQANQLELVGEWEDIGGQYEVVVEAYYVNKLQTKLATDPMTIRWRVLAADLELKPTDLGLKSLANGVQLSGGPYRVPENIPIGRTIGSLFVRTPRDKSFTYDLIGQTLRGSSETVDDFDLSRESDGETHLQLKSPLAVEGTDYVLNVRATYMGGGRGETPVSANLNLNIEAGAPAEESTPTLLALKPEDAGVQYLDDDQAYRLARNKGGKLGQLNARAPMGKILNYALSGGAGADIFEIQDVSDLYLEGVLGNQGDEYHLDVEVSYVNALGDEIRAPLVLPMRVGAEQGVLPSDLALKERTFSVFYDAPAQSYDIGIEASIGKLGRLAASTPTNTELTYTLLNQSDTFGIEADGRLTLKHPLRAIGNQYTYTVKAAYTNADNEIVSSNLPLVLRVVSEQVRGVQLKGTGEVKEHAVEGTVVGEVSALGLSKGLTANSELLTGTDTFKIEDGMLKVARISPDRAKTHTHQLRLRVSYKKSVYETTLPIQVVPQQMTNIRISTAETIDGASNHTLVGELEAVGLDKGLRAHFTLLNKTDTFQIMGQQLLVGTVSPDMDRMKHHLLFIRATYGDATYTSGLRIQIVRSFLGHSEQVSMGLYPNPGTNRVRLIEAQRDSQVRVLRLDGTLVEQNRVRQSPHWLNVQTLPTGAYIVEVMPPKGIRQSAILLKK